MTESNPVTGGTIAHYRVSEGLGCGGMGVVYKAEDLNLHRLDVMRLWRTTEHEKKAVPQERRNESKGLTPLFKAEVHVDARQLLGSFVDLDVFALSRFSPEEYRRIEVPTCAGSDLDSTHSADVDYAEFLPSLFELKAGNFYIALSGERDRRQVLKVIPKYLKRNHRIFVRVIAPIDPRVETPEEVRDRVLEASEDIPIEQLGTTDDCEFSPFSDDEG